MKKRTIPIVIIFAILMTFVLMISPAGAVTDGELDGDDHPNVVLLVMDVGGQPTFRCSATMLTSTVVLTAGHCTNNHPDRDQFGNNVGDYTGMRIFTESDVEQGILDGTNNYPFCNPGDKNCVNAKSWAAHPLYETAPFFVHDVGVVVLKKPFRAGTYGELPAENILDDLVAENPKSSITFTSVGYGLQESFPTPAQFLENNVRTRMVAHPKLIQINVPGFTGDFSLLLSNNSNTGGTCFGDSGGPNFLYDSNVVAGVTSFGLNGNCAGTGGVFRMDRADVLDFVNGYLD